MNSRSLAPPRFLTPLTGIDRVWAGLLLGLGALVVAAPEQGWATLAFTLKSLASVAPFLLLSVAIAAASQASGADNLIARVFQGRTVPMIVVASLFGALSPFCSCGVIPLIAALLAMGVPLPPVMAFWLASPVMDPSMFMLTAGVLGTPFALGKTLAAIGLGLLGGFGTLALVRAGVMDEPLRPGVGNGGCAGGKVRTPKPVVWRFWQEPARRRSFAAGALKNAGFLGKWLMLAFVLESLMLTTVPAEAIAALAGDGGWLSIVVAALVGIPAYLNGYAALPVVSGLVDQGMAPGAAMAFLVAGGVTSIPAAIAVHALARLPVFAAYLGFSLVGAIAAGLLFQLSV